MATLISRDCEEFLQSLNEFDQSDGDCTFAIPYVIRGCTDNSISQRYGDNEIYLLQMMRLPSESRIPIKLDLLVDGLAISYCKLFNIPHQLVGLERTLHPPSRPFVISEFRYLNLDIGDINNLDDGSKKWLEDYCLRVNDQHYFNLLCDSDYPIIGSINPTYRRMRMMKRLSWIPRVKKLIFNTYRSEYTSSLTILRSPEFDNVWRSLSYRDILSDEFDVEHLSRIGVQIPHINLVLDDIRIRGSDITMRDVYLAKKLIPHSTPSKHNLDDLVDRCCIKYSHEVNGRTTLQAVEILIELVRYDRIDLNEYRSCSEFLEHLTNV